MPDLSASPSLEDQLADALADALQEESPSSPEALQSDIAVESATDDAQLEDVAPSPPVAPQDDATPNDAVPEFKAKAGVEKTPAQHSVTGSLLPEDLISALGTDLEDESDAVDERPAHESVAAAPVATAD